MKPHAAEPIPGDLRSSTRRMSYDPGFDMCIVVSDVASIRIDDSTPRIPALILRGNGDAVMYHPRRSSVERRDNLIARPP